MYAGLQREFPNLVIPIDQKKISHGHKHYTWTVISSLKRKSLEIHRALVRAVVPSTREPVGLACARATNVGYVRLYAGELGSGGSAYLEHFITNIFGMQQYLTHLPSLT